MKKYTAVCFLFFMLNSYADDKFISSDQLNIVIDRIEEVENQCTIGLLTIDNKPIGYTIEPAWKNNKKNISSFPKGRYSGFLRYDKNDQWRIQLKNIKGRSGIQIHIGNTVSETQGCILVGKELGKQTCTITRSKDAYAELKEAFYGLNPVSTPNKEIIITAK